MALKGTLKDFALPDIFQLIGMQGKTGVLSLDDGRERVTVRFLEGQVVGADQHPRSLESRLGQVLVRKGRITEEQLEQALKKQSETLQRLGHILVSAGFISADNLRDAFETQVNEIIFRLFRWKEGGYEFNPTEHVDYDETHFTPVTAETILMEGARMVDEWPIIERKIRSPRVVPRKTADARALEDPVQSPVEADMDLGNEDEGEDSGLRLSSEEQDLLRLVDGRATVQEIVDRSSLGEFDVYRILYELTNRNLVEVTSEEETDAAAGGRRMRAWTSHVLRIALGGAAVLSVLTLQHNPYTPWNLGLAGAEVDMLKTYASRARLGRVDRALRLFYLDLGALPDRLERLSDRDYLAERDLRDPWGREYRFETAPGGYRLVGLDAEGRPHEALTLTHRFSAAQRMILDGSKTDNLRAASSTP